MRETPVHQRPGAGSGAASRARSGAAAPPRATAVLIATAAAPGGGPAALLECDGAALVARLAAHLASLGADDVRVITRAEWAGPVLDALAGDEHPVDVRSSDGLADDLEAIAEIAAGPGDAPVVLAQAEIVCHREALTRLLDDRRVATGALGAEGGPAAPSQPPIRVDRGRVVSAGSAHHRVHGPSGSFLGVIRVAAADRPALAAQAARLAALAADPPAAWALAPEPAAPESAREAAGRDAIALVLVALVRGGTPVRLGPLGALEWARPLTGAQAAEAARRLAAADEERIRLDAAVKAQDGFFTTFFVSPYSRHIARWAARRGLSPNQVTTASLAVGVLAAAAFATGERWGLVAGALLLQAAFTLDCVDGQLARYARRFSALGAWLDSTFDRTKEYVVFAGLAVGAQRTGHDVWILAACALALQTIRHSLDFAYASAEINAIGAVAATPLEEPSDGAAPARPAASGPRGEARRAPAGADVLGGWKRLDRWRAMPWIKRMAVFPIGERFAVISITAALWSAQVTFVVLLVAGGVAAAYVQAGRLLRSAPGR